ncbi:lipase family protein [Nocardia sp. NPDC058519]|uniref:lipase family protein n=1 Tax=Nocardia sp. NPDC058519 TaxID=3346535 RepID=UPI003656243E
MRIRKMTMMSTGRGRRKQFYRDLPDLTVSRAECGEVLRVSTMTARIAPGITMRADAFRVLYRSTDLAGNPITVSGAILIPRQSSGSVPLVGFAPGTQGMSRSASVSQLLEKGLEYEGVFIALALARGWAVAVTDYPGLGTQGTHPYVIGPTNGRAVLDVMRAARFLLGTRSTQVSRYGIYGYSEGGNAAAWAAQLNASYAPDLPLAGVAVGAPPADLVEMGKSLDRTAGVFLLMYSAMGLAASFDDLDLERCLNTAGKLMMPFARRLHPLLLASAGFILPKSRTFYLSTDPFEDPAWIERMREASLGYLPPTAPVLVGHGERDRVVAYRQTELLTQRWRELGVEISRHRIRLGGHFTSAPRFARAGFAFLADRFAEADRKPSSELAS